MTDELRALLRDCKAHLQLVRYEGRQFLIDRLTAALAQEPASIPSPLRKEGHSALRVRDGDIEKFDPHPPAELRGRTDMPNCRYDDKPCPDSSCMGGNCKRYPESHLPEYPDNSGREQVWIDKGIAALQDQLGNALSELAALKQAMADAGKGLPVEPPKINPHDYACWVPRYYVNELRQAATAQIAALNAHVKEVEELSAIRLEMILKREAQLAEAQKDYEVIKDAYYGSVPSGATLKCRKCGDVADIDFHAARSAT